MKFQIFRWISMILNEFSGFEWILMNLIDFLFFVISNLSNFRNLMNLLLKKNKLETIHKNKLRNRKKKKH